MYCYCCVDDDRRRRTDECNHPPRKQNICLGSSSGTSFASNHLLKKNPNIPRDICGLTIYNMCSYSDKKYTTKAEQKGICLQKSKRSA